MKQKVNFLIAAMIGAFILSGCATVSEVETEFQVPEMQIPYFYYSFEIFRISLEHFQSLPWPTQAMLEAESYDEMFEAIVAAKEAWARYSVEHHGASTDSSENLYDFLIEHGLFSSEVAEEEIYFLDSVGNNIFVFMYAPDENYVLIMYCQRLPSFEMAARIAWSTMQGDGVLRHISMNAAKAEIMLLFDRYSYVVYNTEAIGRADIIQREITAVAQLKSFGVDLPEATQTLGWLQNTNYRDFAYGMNIDFLDEMMASLIGGDIATVIVVRGENVYTFSFQNVQYSNIRDDQIIHSTSQFRDLFERHLARILSDNYLRNH